MRRRITASAVLICCVVSVAVCGIGSSLHTNASTLPELDRQPTTPTPPPPEAWSQLQQPPATFRGIRNGPAVVIRVPEDYPTIAQALAVATPGDTVLVAAGVYCGNVTVPTGVHLAGSGPFATYVDGCAGGTVVYMRSDSMISDVTIRNSGPGHWDAGIMAWQGTVTVERSVIQDNGMGIVLDCAQVSCQGRPNIVNNVIAHNRATGLRISPFHSADVINNTFVANNEAITGDLNLSTSLMVNNIIAFHPWAGIWAIEGETGSAGNNFWANAVDFRDASPLPDSQYLDPVFVDQAAADFHLNGLSPLIDLGNSALFPDNDIDSDLRPLDGNGDGTPSVDIGMDEYSDVPLANTPTPTPTATPSPTPTATPTPGPSLLRPSVFVVSFPGYGGARGDPTDLTSELVGLLKRGSMYHGHFDPLVQPYFEFEVYGGSVVEDPILPVVLPNGAADYGELYERYDLCSLIADGLVDEVWFWVGNGDLVTLAGFGEWVTHGTGWTGNFWPPASYVNAPDCGKIVTTMAFNYTREVDVALESFSHRLEGFFMTYFPCDFYTENWPWTYYPAYCSGLVSDVYGFVARPFAGNNYIGGCGDAHTPPNILDLTAYYYNSPTTVQSSCYDWAQDGTAQIASFSCDAWGCTHWGYHVWWMQNLPGYQNTNRDRNGDLHPNWWSFLFGPCYDYNQTGSVDALDIQRVAVKWGLHHGDSGWTDHYDYDHDWDIDIVDLMRVASTWGTTCP